IFVWDSACLSPKGRAKRVRAPRRFAPSDARVSPLLGETIRPLPPSSSDMLGRRGGPCTPVDVDVESTALPYRLLYGGLVSATTCHICRRTARAPLSEGAPRAAAAL